MSELLGARAYRGRAHAVLILDAASLVGAYERKITLAAINTGSTLYNPPLRGSETLLPIAEYPFEHYRRLRRTSRKAVAELAVDYAIPDALEHAVRVEMRQDGRPAAVIWPKEDA